MKAPRSRSFALLSALMAAAVACGGVIKNEDTSVTYATIQDAIDAALDGHTITLTPDTYSETIIIGKAITLKSTGGAAVTTIDGGGGGTKGTAPVPASPGFLTGSFDMASLAGIAFDIDGVPRGPGSTDMGAFDHPTGFVIPEPASLALLGIGATALLRRRRRSRRRARRCG